MRTVEAMPRINIGDRHDSEIALFTEISLNKTKTVCSVGH